MRSQLSLGTAMAALTAIVLTTTTTFAKEWLSGIKWDEPAVVTPGENNAAPSDAKVLFDGKDLSQWENGDRWEIKDGYAIVKGAGIRTKEGFGDCQLHVEYASPEEVKGTGQGRGNSGIFLMGIYEVQVLDNYENKTYFDGQCGAIYKQSPPQVNVCRPPGKWQSMDIIFHAPRFKDGKLEKPAYITVLHNGVVIQAHFELKGDTPFNRAPAYKPHADKLPISLQNHGNPVRYRNIWIREIKPVRGVLEDKKTDEKKQK